MNSVSALKHWKSGNYEYIYIYFKHKGKIIRINTKQKYIKGCHKKDLFYNTMMPNYKGLNQELKNLQNKVDQYIVHKMQWWRPEVTQKGCLHFIKTGNFEIDEHQLQQHLIGLESPKDKTLIDHYETFLFEKQEQFKNNIASIKDYRSLGVALKKYQDTNKVMLTFDIINDRDFFNRFKNYLSNKHNNNTTHKRISCLKTFMYWIEEKGMFFFKSSVFRYKIKTFRTKFVTLSREEIQQLQDLEIENKNWAKIIDVFVCNCFMSLRFSDLMTMEKGEFTQDEDGDYTYTKRNEKTDVEIEVSIVPSALTILQKYDFKLPTYTNQYFNRQLQYILEQFDLFPEIVKKTYLQGDEPAYKECKKRELVTSHTARRSFITNSISENVNLNAIQAATGHTQLGTLSKYNKRNTDKQQLRAID